MPVLSRRGQRRPERRIADDEDDDNSSSQNRLPEYEPLSCPLTAEAKRAIADLSNSRDVHRYENHLKASIRHLGFSVVGINDAVRTRHEALARFAEKRAESQSQGVDSKTDLDSQEKPQRELDIEAHTASLDEEVPRLTAEAEAALRDLIDRQTELLDEKAALADTVNYFQTLPEQAPLQRGGRTRAEANGRGGGDPDEENNDAADESVLPPPPEYSVIDIFRQQRAEKLTEYERMTAYQRYAVNNDYAAFKKLWHDAAHGDAEVSLPNAKRWFDDAGNPVVPVVSRGGGNANGEPAAAAEADDSDDDLVIAGENREYRCPLSMQLFQNPVSNNACSHTFEKAAITEFLRRSPGHRAQCPVAGCSKEITLTDVYEDPVILRKMKRALEQQRRREEEEEEREDDNSEGNGDDDEPRVVKRQGRSAGRKRRKVEDIVDDDEE